MKKDKIGDKKAMRIILDPALNWDKNFISPREAQSAKTTLSTLEDRATYWKESEVAATHRNLANTKRRALYEGQKARGPVLGDDDCACGVCSRHIDVFSVDDDIIGCDRFKDCGRMFHKSCLLRGGYDISLSTGCVICKGKSKFIIKTISKTASSKAGKKRPATSAVDRSEPSNVKAPASSVTTKTATKRKRFSEDMVSADSVANPPQNSRLKEPDPDVYINKNAKTGLTARLSSSGIERNGASYNPLHDAGQSVAAALLLAEGAGACGGRKRPAQPKKSWDKSRDSMSSMSSTGTARTEPESDSDGFEDGPVAKPATDPRERALAAAERRAANHAPRVASRPADDADVVVLDSDQKDATASSLLNERNLYTEEKVFKY